MRISDENWEYLRDGLLSKGDLKSNLIRLWSADATLWKKPNDKSQTSPTVTSDTSPSDAANDDESNTDQDDDDASFQGAPTSGDDESNTDQDVTGDDGDASSQDDRPGSDLAQRVRLHAIVQQRQTSRR